MPVWLPVMLGLVGSTNGYWKASPNGGSSRAAEASCRTGTTSAQHLNQPITQIVSTPDGGGYWLVAKDGGIFAFGDAGFYGSTGGHGAQRIRRVDDPHPG